MRRKLVAPVAIVLCLFMTVVAVDGDAAAQVGDQRPRTERTDSDAEPGPDDSAEQAVRQIINGTPIDISERPWHVYVGNSFFDGSWCGGSLIAPNLVLTAAHCLDTLPPAQFVFVSAGSNAQADTEIGQYQYAASYTLHPTWDPNAVFGPDQGVDLALVELPRSFQLGPNVQTVPLATQAETNAALGSTGLLAGWGVTSLPADAGETSEILLSGSGEIISDGLCDALNPGRAINRPLEICVDGLLSNQTGCFGDSGGALVTDVGGVFKQIGIASWTVLDCSQRFMGFAETAAALNWISSNSPAANDGAGFVTGRLWQDLDEDGIEDPDEPGLANATVNLSMVRAADAPEIVFLTDITDADGNYSFITPFPGWYEVITSPEPAYSPSGADLGFDDTVDNDFRFFTSDSRSHAQPRLVRGGETVSDVDGGFIATAIVSGVVFEDLDLDGAFGANDTLIEGIEGSAWVDVLKEDGSLIASHAIHNGAEFRFSLPGGTYQLQYFPISFDRPVTYPDRGGEAVDNDFSPYTRKTMPFTVPVGLIATHDLGLIPADAAPITTDVANANCDGAENIIDALVIAQFVVGIRQDVGACPLANPATEIVEANGDFNLDGETNIVDALLVARCDAGIIGFFCD